MTTRWGILGAGRIAAKVGSDIQATDGNEVVAIGSRDRERAATLATTLSAARAYGSYPQLLADADLDVIYLATTHRQHIEPALLALRAGKPLLVEKAFAINADETQTIIDEARQRQLFCMEAMWMRTNPLVREAQQLVADGVLGTVLSVSADHGQLFPYDPTNRLYDLTVGGGALLDLGVYSATFAHLFLGSPASIDVTGALAPTGADQTVAMQWSYPDDRYAHVTCTSQSQTPNQGLVVGTHGWLRLGTPFYTPDTLTVCTAAGTRTKTVPRQGFGYQHEIAEVDRCLREGLLESPLVPLADTLAIMEIMDEARARLGVEYPGEH